MCGAGAVVDVVAVGNLIAQFARIVLHSFWRASLHASRRVALPVHSGTTTHITISEKMNSSKIGQPFRRKLGTVFHLNNSIKICTEIRIH